MMYNNNSVIKISGQSLYINRISYVTNYNCEPEYLETFISGEVVYPNGEVVIGAGIEIVELGNYREIIANTFTDEKGEYRIEFKYKPYLNYELNIYDIASN